MSYDQYLDAINKEASDKSNRKKAICKWKRHDRWVSIKQIITMDIIPVAIILCIIVVLIKIFY